MQKISFITGNTHKFNNAQAVCTLYDIDLTKEDFDIDEIQSEDPKLVAKDKAAKAYDRIKSPIVITDHSWSIPGLNGFPGVYMHSMNHWFTPQDFLNLTQSLKDRRAILTIHLIYKSRDTEQVFTKQIEGTLLSNIKGTSKYPFFTITTMPSDNGLSVAEVYASSNDKSKLDTAEIWHDFAKWLKSQKQR